MRSSVALSMLRGRYAECTGAQPGPPSVVWSGGPLDPEDPATTAQSEAVVQATPPSMYVSKSRLDVSMFIAVHVTPPFWVTTAAPLLPTAKHSKVVGQATDSKISLAS